MIDPDAVVFPNNVVLAVSEQAELLDPDLFVIRRPLRESDPNQSVGVFPSLWDPAPDSLEMRGAPPGINEETIQRYYMGIQGFVKDMDEQRGLAAHSVLSKMIRSMLYHNATLRANLRALNVVIDGSTERMMRWGIRSQRFLSNELSGSWLYLSTLEFWCETENI